MRTPPGAPEGGLSGKTAFVTGGARGTGQLEVEGVARAAMSFAGDAKRRPMAENLNISHGWAARDIR